MSPLISGSRVDWREQRDLSSPGRGVSGLGEDAAGDTERWMAQIFGSKGNRTW